MFAKVDTAGFVFSDPFLFLFRLCLESKQILNKNRKSSLSTLRIGGMVKQSFVLVNIGMRAYDLS